MDAEPARLIIEALKEEKIDLYVTLPEDPTASLTQAVQADPYFQCVTVASEAVWRSPPKEEMGRVYY